MERHPESHGKRDAPEWHRWLVLVDRRSRVDRVGSTGSGAGDFDCIPHHMRYVITATREAGYRSGF